MNKKTMAAVALFCMTCVNMLFTSCSSNDVPVIVDDTTLNLIESNFTAGNGITLENNMINYGEFSLSFKTNKPTELKESDFTVNYETDGAMFTPGWPIDGFSENPEIVMSEPYLNPNDQWVVKVKVFLACMAQGQLIDVILKYKGEKVGDTLKVDYARPYSLYYEGSDDGFLYVGKTYPIKVEGFAVNREITKDDILAVGYQRMTPEHKDEFEVELNDETGVPYVKILDTFTFTNEEKAAGYALICPDIMLTDDIGSVFQVVPVKVPIVEID